jgi:hypothetical protein
MLSQKELSLARANAKELGLKIYIGNLCAIHPELNGERVIWNGTCRECYKIKSRANAKKWRNENPEAAKAIKLRYSKSGRRQQRANERYKENPQPLLDNHKRWRQKPEVSQRLREKALEWKKNNRARATANQIMRQISISLATPTWVNREEFFPYYVEAERLSMSTGTKYHVDHIVPLKGKTVCGLHVPWNLQVIPAIENVRKSNFFDPEADAIGYLSAPR